MNKRSFEIRNICTKEQTCWVLENALTSFGPILSIHEIKPIQAVQYLHVIIFLKTFTFFFGLRTKSTKF